MTTAADTITAEVGATPEQLRNALADTIASRGTFRTTAVERAFRTVERHKFLPGHSLEDAYTARSLVTQRGADGTALSSASQPNLVADMLEQACLQPGQRVLEIGAATGINAALISELVGPTGTVVTIEFDPELADGARTALPAAGYPHVTVITGDGAFGAPDLAPFDCILVTCGAWTIAESWWQQLAIGGRMVVPLRLHESGLTRCFALVRTTPTQLLSTEEPLVCGFVPMRGVDEHDDSHVRLADDVILNVDAADRPDRAALADALSHPRQASWTGIQLTDSAPVGHLDLWLLTHASTPFGRLGVGAITRGTGLIPAYRWAGAALYDGGTIAYLAFRENGEDTNDLGVIAHGPDAAKLAAELSDLLHRWNDSGRPNVPTVTVHVPTSPTSPTTAAAAEITRPHAIISIKF